LPSPPSSLPTTNVVEPFSSTLSARHICKGERNYLGMTPTDGGYGTAAAVRMEDNHVPGHAVFGLNAIRR
jgi:hypothetical protein